MMDEHDDDTPSPEPVRYAGLINGLTVVLVAVVQATA